MTKTISDMKVKGELILKCKSETTDEIYEVRHEGGSYSCTCMGFATSKKRPKICKHIRRYFLKNMLEALIGEYTQDKLDITIEEVENLFKKEV